MYTSADYTSYSKGTYDTGSVPYQATQQATYSPATYNPQEIKSFSQIPTAQPYMQAGGPVLSTPLVNGADGIGILQQFEHVTVKQHVEMAEVFLGFETSNKYSVLGPQGQLLFRCGEKSSIVTRYLLGPSRPMTIDIVDNNMQAVMSINRPFKLWKKNIKVGNGQGGLLGVIRKKFSITRKKFILENASGQVLYTLEGNPILPRKFKILDNSGREVGQVLKRWGGLAKELFTDADTFTCFFPPASDNITRALLVATTLFIDLTHFEK